MSNPQTLPATSALFIRLGKKLASNILTNWRLTLLAFTSISLSIASGWTTFDGITNFTHSPLLSLMITFGIQGVMLVTAWLIGETLTSNQSSSQLSTQSFARSVTGDILSPYAKGLKAILTHLPLWFMFLTCMAISVFFSFDSLFSTIFPQSERARTGTFRTQNEVRSIVNDLHTTIENNRAQAAKEVLSLSPWQTYETKITRLLTIKRENEKLIDDFAAAERNAEESDTAIQKQKILSLKFRIKSLSDEHKERQSALEASATIIESRSQEIASFDLALRKKQSEIVALRAEAEAELQGVGGTGKVGEGPQFRALNKQITKARIEQQTIETQRAASRRDLNKLKSRRNAEQATIASLAKNIAQLQTNLEAATAALQRTTHRTSSIPIHSNNDHQRNMLDNSLQVHLTTFRQHPTPDGLQHIQSTCNFLITRLSAIPALKAELTHLDCAPGPAATEISKLFALHKLESEFSRACQYTGTKRHTTDEEIAFAQTCIDAANLSSDKTEQFRRRLSGLALNRDDLAHRFVVTWNAFNDSNRLAYLALAVAIAIDSLVFMSGLFGAAATQSPLKESPRAGKRSIAQLHAIIDNALRPDNTHAANITVAAMQPMNDRANTGFTASIDLNHLTAKQRTVTQKVLTAGATLGLVEQSQKTPSIFLVRSQLFEYLSSIAARAPSTAITAVSPTAISPPSQRRGSMATINAEETRLRYVSELISQLDLNFVDEEFVRNLQPLQTPLRTALNRWRQTVPPINSHLKREEQRLKHKLEKAHTLILENWSQNTDILLESADMEKDTIWDAIILGETLPLLKNHVKRALDDAELNPEHVTQQIQIQQWTDIHDALERFISGSAPNSIAEELIATLASARAMT